MNVVADSIYWKDPVLKVGTEWAEVRLEFFETEFVV